MKMEVPPYCWKFGRYRLEGYGVVCAGSVVSTDTASFLFILLPFTIGHVAKRFDRHSAGAKRHVC